MAQSSKDCSGASTKPNAETAASGPGPYRINVAAELSGTPAATLRAWERRYGVPAPRRTTAAYRLYTAEDVALIRRMSSLVATGMAPAEAARHVLAQGGTPEVESAEIDSDMFELARKRLIAATQRWDGRTIDEELLRLTYLVDAQTLYTRVVSPLLVEVGARWEQGALSVAQEHLLSEKIEHVLRGALRTIDHGEGPLALMACIENEDHVIGMLGAALRLAATGWRVAVLGAATPPEALGEAVRSMSPGLVGLSVTRLPPRPKALFKAYAKAISPTPWVVGGVGANDVEQALSVQAASLPLAPELHGINRCAIGCEGPNHDEHDAEVFFGAAVLGTTLMTSAQSDASMPSARVVDGNDHSFDLMAASGKPVLVVYEDKDSAQLNAPFKAELARLAKGDKYRRSVALIPVADVRGYDYWPIRGFVKDAILKESKKQGTPIYCDWNGDFARKLSLQKGTSNIVLYSKTGQLLFLKQGILSPAEIQQAIGLLKTEVEGTSS